MISIGYPLLDLTGTDFNHKTISVYTLTLFKSPSVDYDCHRTPWRDNVLFELEDAHFWIATTVPIFTEIQCLTGVYQLFV